MDHPLTYRMDIDLIPENIKIVLQALNVVLQGETDWDNVQITLYKLREHEGHLYVTLDVQVPKENN